jgi:hypothetical protein
VLYEVAFWGKIGYIIVKHTIYGNFPILLSVQWLQSCRVEYYDSTIAEKFDAILQRFELTDRMKDLFIFRRENSH